MRDPIWLRVGQILPRGVRERIFEPAFYDLVAEMLSTKAGARSRRPFGLLVVWTALECVGIGVFSALVRQRRPTRAAWMLVGIVAFSAFLVVMRAGYETG